MRPSIQLLAGAGHRHIVRLVPNPPSTILAPSRSPTCLEAQDPDQRHRACAVTALCAVFQPARLPAAEIDSGLFINTLCRVRHVSFSRVRATFLCPVDVDD